MSFYYIKYQGADDSICNLRHAIPCEIPVIADNRSSHYFHLMIKHFLEKFDSSDFDCLGENSKKYINFSASMDKSANKMDKKNF